MRRMMFILVWCIMASPLCADYGLSNVVTKEIRRPEPVEEAILEKGEETAPEFVKAVYYPFTIHMSSWKEYEAAVRQIQENPLDLEPIFITKIDLGSSGVWNRVDYGAFHSIKDAVFELRALQAQGVIEKGAFVGDQVPFAIEVGVFTDAEGAMERSEELRSNGIISYILKESEDYYRLLVGAYPDIPSASPAVDDLKALGLNPIITKR
ncbi:MAG: SPOR domain-containing protein [Desulfomonilia bacterium]